LRIVKRNFWIKRIEEAWRRQSVVWLSGVRRVGKTVLCRSLKDVEYFDCELPRVRMQMEDPEGFLDGLRGQRVALDEIHRLDKPSELLKIAADHYPDIHVIATGSSGLGASSKFGDTLAGRKIDIRLTPMILPDLDDFQNTDIDHRLLRGGLPPFFLAESLPERDFQDWMDAYWAKDIQELFRLERRASFVKFVELVLAHSGSIFEATRYAKPCDVSRMTIANYLGVLEATSMAHVIRPFSSHRPTEIVSAPKVYAFDTGFVCAFRGWRSLRRDDMGYLWKHLVLNELQARLAPHPIGYWRDKQGHEVDFVLAPRGEDPVAIECKWSADRFDARGLQALRRQYPKGGNIVVGHDVKRKFKRRFGELEICFHSLKSLIAELL